MSKTMKRVSALLLAILMILAYMPMMQETAYAAKAKKPGAVKGLKVKKSGNKINISWKKAKNAKKYSVSIKDNTTKLTATKSTKKKKLTIKGQYGTKYTITVKGVNGKKKGKAAKKSIKLGADPKLTKALKEAAENKKTAEQLEKDLAAAMKALETAKTNSDKQAEAVKKAQAIIDAYEALTDAQKAAVPEELKKAIEDAKEAVQEAQLAAATELSLDSWNPEVKKALNDMIKANSGKANKYVVFDFDNTCSIFDVEEQLAVYQLQTMAFDETVDAAKLEDMLKTELNPEYFTAPAPASVDYCANADATYQDWIDDITAAYQKLLDKGYKPSPEGVAFEQYKDDPDWKEFATKMRAMYDCVFDSESAAVAYPWVLYWFTGMTEEEVYQLAKRSHSFYKEEESAYVTWETAGTGSKIGSVSYEFTWGTQVSKNINELMAALDNNGIDVWVCSASATDPIRAAIDVWGLHDHVTGLMAMTNKLEDDKYINEYDWDGGYAWLAKDGGAWEKDTALQKSQTQGEGKVLAIENVVMPKYDGYGPIAGFMDSTGDYNFCTEFKDLEVVCCFNRASRKVTDGGGVIAELAVYQADTLNYDYDKARKAGDTLYVLQGREENGLRGLRPERETMRLGKTSTLLFRGEENFAQLDKMIELNMDTKTIVDDFAIKTAANDPKYGFSFKYGFVTGQYNDKFKADDFYGYHSKGKGTEVEKTQLELDSWNPEVKKALNEMIKANSGKANKYVVFDFDNTCSIFDVEEQLAVYQLQTMAFDETVDAAKLEDMLKTELNPEYFTAPAPASVDYCANADATYQDWIDDITAAYQRLLDKGYQPSPEGVEFEKYKDDADWKEFATKMRAMYDCVFDSESADVAYPWVLYWFTGMTEEEVYQLAKRSHSFYKEEESAYVTWETAGADSKIGACSYEFTWGTQVSENINELMAALDSNGIDVWVCSASATDPIRAAIDVWGLHDHVTGLLAMTNKLDGDNYINEYDYDSGYCWYPKDGGAWEKGTVATKAQTQGKGKVTAIQNVCGSKYKCGPIAGFMDSTGDYNFCTEFEDLQVVCCFNRASRKVTDGGGVIAELAVYQADTLKYDYAKAQAAGDTLYVLQGREENGLRGLRPERETMRLGKTETLLFRGDDNFTQLQYMIDNKMSTADIVDLFAIKRAAGETGNPFSFKIGFLKEYSGYHSQGASDTGLLKHADWNPEVKRALNEFIKANANKDQYVVFDFDNTCSIFDVEEQLAVYQLQTMAFDETVDAAKLEDMLKTELNPEYFTAPAPASVDYCANADATYQDWIDDITAAYQKLLDKGYRPSPEGVEFEQYKDDPDWKEFATKMRAMYDCVFDSESAAVAYPWVLYWFTGMTEEEVYQLAKRSHSFYKEEESAYVTWETAGTDSKIGACSYEFTWGTQVSDNIVELWKALDANGIDVWVCSASATDPIRAAIDVWGGHDYITGLLAMTNKLEGGKYINAYDWEGGNAWLSKGGEWRKDTELQKTQTQGKGKVIAIQNVLYPKYDNHGPIAGFMDSTGDYNFCTEFETLQLVVCFNRASRKVTDGGGVIAELAVYQADNLGYDFAKAQAAGDTLYVLQGREENGLRGFRPERATLRLGKSEPQVFRDSGNEVQLQNMIDDNMTTQEAVDIFAIKTAADAEGNKYGYKYGFVEGKPGKGLGPKFHDDTYNPDDLDFSGYHSQK